MTDSAPPTEEEFRDSQREAWSSVAAAWRRWWRIFELGAGPLNERLVELSGARPGHRALDVATGIGEPALTAARVVGPDGRVVATDLSPEMLRFAAERARDAGLSNVEFLEFDAEQLDVEPSSFDAATSRWGFMLMRDPSAAIERVRAALRPGAKLAAAVWGPPEKAPFLATARRALERELGLPPADPDEPGPFRLGAEGALDALLEAGGFESVTHERMTVPIRFASVDEYAECTRDMSSSLRKALAKLSEERQERAWAAIREEASKYATASGELHFENLSWCVHASAP